MKRTQSKQQADKENRHESRRSFLRKGVAVSGGLVGGAALSTEASAAVEAQTEKPASEEGYRLTDHISEYYKSAKL